MKRLYVGGLSHSITQKDLRDRFGKFGSVEDVELRTRSDDEGVPYKTFGYINITISDDDFKKCMTVLNKSKWKGGTLLIEPAKESLLQRLKQEREARTQESPSATHQDSKKKVLDSLRSAGVENFHMKSAVPGTEVPGHKEWVVSKFGRVLPVLNLRCRRGSKTRSMKYDPSKHSHNIKRLELSPDTLTSVTQLTWELPGGDDDISKKRRGEFPLTQPWRPKRSRVEPAPTSAGGEQTNGVTAGHIAEEEIHSMSQDALGHSVEEDNLEVVREDFLVGSRRRSNGGVCAGKEEEDYDSADTDELLASNKPPPSSLREHAGKGSLQVSSGKDQKKTSSSAEDDEDDEDDADDFKQSDPKADISQQATLSSLKSSSADCDDEDEDGEVESDGDENSEVESDGDEDGELKSDGDEDGEVESDSDEEGEVETDGNEEGEVASDGDEDGELESDSDGDGDEDLDYDAMFSNCTRLEVSLNDLQRLAKDAETATPSMPQPLGPVASPGPQKGTTPEEILAALLEEDSGDDVKTKKKKKKKRSSMWSPLPAFQGTSGLLGEEEEEGGGSTRRRQDIAEPCSVSQSAGSEPQPQEEEKQKGCYVSVTKDDDDSSSEEEEEEGGVVTADSAGLNQETSSGSSEEDEKEEGGVMADPPALSHEPSSGSSEEKEEEEEVAGGPDRTLDPERRRLDNKRRLEAVVQRHQQNQNHRKLIQGALASLDTCAAAPGQHIVFSSDEEEEPDDDDNDDDAAAPANQRAALKEKDKVSGSKLFEDEEDEEEDDSRFQIKPQFEGRAGRRLMEIQSGFGTDDRFRMDSRFAEEEEEREAADEVMETGGEEEEGLEEERKMNLSILQSVLNNNPQLQTKLKTSSKAQTFRDVQALHYDPSRQEHAVFEDKMEDAAKEGKASRKRKKQKEVELPEVSTEIYYDVCEELKGVFGGVGPGHPGGGAIMQEASSWDRREEQQEETKEEKEEQSAFKFSFFQDETQTSKETEYQVEAIKEPRVSWQLESGFQDSSSEDDDDDDAAADEEKVQQSRCDPAEESVTSSNRDLFFYYPEDSRLTEGPQSFCRSSQLKEDDWEEKRNALIQDCRNTHKKARRKCTKKR
ncbi:Nucleolar protein 8 [Merluccius polli]|uniref:Nucleolar protein 8 n=1 Tax=Merluccius polli TaxID=89951 RepID=A0AA47MVD1_MERPO|nr:Nucleolar protein 8 [Merluccius polli]